MTKQQERAEILYQMQHGLINTNDALEMLNDLDEKYQDVDTNETYDQMVERLVNKTVADMNMEAVFTIMSDMGWVYAGGGEDNWMTHSVTEEEVTETAKTVVRDAINQMIHNQVTNNYPFAMTGTGGFMCKAWVDDDDWDNIQIELMFIPYQGFGSGHADKLVEKYKEKEGQK